MTTHAAAVRTALVLAILSVGVMPASADQAGPDVSSVSDLKAPPAPAFVLLGVAPTKIERPQGVRPFVMSLMSSAGETGFPKNIAVELAPYWLQTPNLSFDDYYRGGIRDLVRQLSVSVATTPLGADGDGTGIGIGVRTLPLPGRPHPRLAALRAELSKQQRALAAMTGFFADRPRLIELLQAAQSSVDKAVIAELETAPFKALLDEMEDLDLEAIALEIQLQDLEADARADATLPESERVKRAEARKSDEASLQAKLRDVRQRQATLTTRMVTTIQKSRASEWLATAAVLQALSGRLEPAHKSAIDRLARDVAGTAARIQALDDQRVGLLFAVAAGLAWDVPGDDVRETALSQRSVWLTPGYRFLTCPGASARADCTATLDVLGVARYVGQRRTGQSTWEYGARVVWQPIARLAASVEWLDRTRPTTNVGTRVVGVAEYQVTDTAFLYAAFGRDFRAPDVGRTLVSTLGVTLGFGKQPTIARD